MKNLTMVQWKAMIKDTILKELRSKTLIFIFIATTLAIFLAHSVLKMFISNNDQNFMISGANSLSFMFNLINFWSVIIAGIFGISSVRSDFKDKIIYQYLTFPISRTQYMFSRIFGSWLLVFSYYLYAYLLSAVLFSIATSSVALHWTHLISMLLMGLYIFIVIFISFMFSLVAGKIPSFLLLIMTVILISASNNTFRTLEYSDYFKSFGVFKVFGFLIYCLLPRINYITELSTSVMFQEKVSLNLPLEALHLIATSGLLMFLADRLVKRKDF